MPRLLFRLSAVSGFLSVLLGALGAHALKKSLDAGGMLDAWHTAAHYQLVHAVAALILVAWAESCPARAPRLARIAALWLIGGLLFSGSIYGLAVGGPRLLGPITPLGGLGFLAGWALLVWEGGRPPRD